MEQGLEVTIKIGETKTITANNETRQKTMRDKDL